MIECPFARLCWQTSKHPSMCGNAKSWFESGMGMGVTFFRLVTEADSTDGAVPGSAYS